MADELEHSDLSADESEEEDGEYAPEFVQIRRQVSNHCFSSLFKTKFLTHWQFVKNKR